MSSLSSTVQDVFNEPGCGKNQGKSEKERKKGCTKQLQPGAAAGGCAFDGAKIALQPVTDVAHLVHGPIACEGNGWDNRGAKSSGSMLYRTASAPPRPRRAGKVQPKPRGRVAPVAGSHANRVTPRGAHRS
jgi:nitrogenase molybdenum-iron protein alpha/beta subunit